MKTLAVIVVLGFLWIWFRSRLTPAVTGDGSYRVGIVGESHYQDAIRAECGKGKVRHECDAVLVLEDSNAYDDQAVKVTISGGTVGYLSRDQARIYRKRTGNDPKPRTVSAVIVGGGKGKASVGVWLDLA